MVFAGFLATNSTQSHSVFGYCASNLGAAKIVARGGKIEGASKLSMGHRIARSPETINSQNDLQQHPHYHGAQPAISRNNSSN